MKKAKILSGVIIAGLMFSITPHIRSMETLKNWWNWLWTEERAQQATNLGRSALEKGEWLSKKALENKKTLATVVGTIVAAGLGSKIISMIKREKEINEEMEYIINSFAKNRGSHGQRKNALDEYLAVKRKRKIDYEKLYKELKDEALSLAKGKKTETKRFGPKLILLNTKSNTNREKHTRSILNLIPWTQKKMIKDSWYPDSNFSDPSIWTKKTKQWRPNHTIGPIMTERVHYEALLRIDNKEQEKN